MRGIYWWAVDSPHKLPCHDVIQYQQYIIHPVLPDTVWKVARDLLKSVHGTKSYTEKYTDVSHLYTIKR